MDGAHSALEAGIQAARERSGRERRFVGMTFLVYDERGAPASELSLRNAHLLEADDVVIPGRTTFERGLLRCEPAGAASAASLALQWPVARLGRLTLRTCLLPQRQAPYVLSLELARHAIMLFLVKLEDWGLHELPADDPAMETFERARSVFIDALCAQPTPAEGEAAPADPFAHATAEQDRLAREALALAVEAGERLALARADEDLGRRLARTGAPTATSASAESKEPVKVAGRPTIGCSVTGGRFSGPLRKVVEESFDFIAVPMRWVDIEPAESRYDFSTTDRWIEWAVRTAKMPVVGGPIIDLGPGASPDWIHIWENDYETLRELVFEHVKKVVTRYRRAVRTWTITSSLQVAESFHLSVEEALDLTRTCALIVRKVQKNARIQAEIAQPFGEYGATQAARTLPPHHYAELLCQAGVPVDVFGVRVQVGDPSPGRSTRDLATLSHLLDRLAVFEKPIAVTALGAPAGVIPPAREDVAASRDGGDWRGGWSETTQADWMTRMLLVALAKPFITSVCWQELYDTEAGGMMRFGGLISAEGQPRQALKRMTEIHRRLTRPPAAAQTEGAGVEELATAAPPDASDEASA